MSSSSATPISLFENLAIDLDMSSTNTEIRSRAIVVRDVLSSFNRDILPTEYKTQIFTELDRPSQHRPPVSQWTIQEDLEGTLLQWGAYNDETYEVLRKLQSQPILARCFYEKVQRRLGELFTEYDRLPNSLYTIRDDIERIAEGFRNVVAAVNVERPHAGHGQESIARILLDALVRVSHRHMDLVTAPQSSPTTRRGKRRTTSSPDGPACLFDALIRTPQQQPEEEAFIVGVLETFPRIIFANLHSEYTSLVGLLQNNRAPPSFQYRVGRLLNRVDTRSPPTTVTESQSQGISVQLVPTTATEINTGSDNTQDPQSQVPPRTDTPPAPTTGTKHPARPSKRGKKSLTR